MTKGGDGIQIDEGGFVRIHHEILEVLATAPLRGQQFRCLMFLFRKTYGFNKKEVKISLTEWATGTSMKRQNVWRELQKLMECNVIHGRSGGSRRAMTWGFNKYHEQWNFESVITGDDRSVIVDDYRFTQSVITGDYRNKQPVITGDDRSVITSPHTRDLKDIKTTTTTAKGGGGSGDFISDPQGAVLQCWRDNMETPLTPIMVTELRACVTDHGAPAVMEAITIAVGADTRTLRYVKGVLNRRRESTNGLHVNGANGYVGMTLIRTGDDND